MKKCLAISALLALACAPALASQTDLTLSARLVRTWLDDSTRVFMLEGDARVERDGSTLAADNMVLWFNEKEARKTGRMTLTVYSETGGLGAVNTLTTEGALTVSDAGFSAAGRPVHSPLLARAVDARRQWQRALRESARAAVPPTPAAPPGAPPSLVPGAVELAEEGPIEIRYAPVDSDGYSLKTSTRDDETLVTIRGGIKITFAVYTMRADNIVIWHAPATEDTEQRLQLYAEGDVSFRSPAARLDAKSLFFDYGLRRALLTEAEVYTHLSGENIPLVLRAGEVRVFSDRVFRARNVSATTCEFGVPHFRVESRKVTVTVLGDREDRSALVAARDNRFFLGEVPVLWLPNVSRDIKETHTPLRRVEVGNSDQFGNYVQTRWDLLDMFAGRSGESVAARVSRWADLTGNLDYYEDRGTGGGIDAAYELDEITGEFIGYYLDDRGTDVNGYQPTSEDRWRLKWRQRAFFGTVQFDTELSKISDRGFLREYYEQEAKEGKEQETYLYAKKPWDNAQASFLYRARLNDFQSQTEYLPEARFDVASYSFLDGRLIYRSTTRAGNLRFRPDKDLPVSSYQTQRADTWHEFDLPTQAGGFTFAPFATVRSTWYDEAADGDQATRYVGSWGARLGLPPLWRVWNVESALLDIHRLRHIAVLDFTYEDFYDATKTPDELLAFDEVEQVDTFEAATIRLKQRLQTRRRSATEGEPDRTVDLLSLEVESDYFPEPGRDNAGNPWSDVRLYGRANVTDDFSILTDSDYDTYDDRFDKAGVWLYMDHGPRTTWGLGHRYLRDISTSTVTGHIDHEITDRWSIGLLGQYDFDEDKLLEETVVLRRNLHRFILEMAVDYDRGRDDTSVSVRIYPLAGQRPAPLYWK
jgi:lipopolysaccharide assembly outer membrane protein LptD (OstA)